MNGDNKQTLDIYVNACLYWKQLKKRRLGICFVASRLAISGQARIFRNATKDARLNQQASLIEYSNEYHILWIFYMLYVLSYILYIFT